MPGVTRGGQAASRIGDTLAWLLLFSTLWLLLTRGEGLWFGMVVVLLTTFSALALRLRPLRIRFYRLPGALLFFSWALMSGAFNVAKRTVQRDCQLRPAWVRYQFSSTDPAVLLLISNIVGLLPGTVASRIDAGEMVLHLLDESVEWQVTIAAVERQVVGLMGRGSHGMD